MLQPLELERDRAYRSMRALVLEGAFRYDEPLSERSLARRLGVGRTPTREAVRRLVAEGLLTSLPARGIFVRRLQANELRELYEVRFAIEGMAAYLAAEKCTSGDLDIMERTLALLELEDDVHMIQDIGWQFHKQVFAVARNDQLSAIYDAILGRVITAMRMTLEHDPQRVHRTVADHLAILKTIRSRDPRRAEQTMRQHLQGALESRLAIEKTLREGRPREQHQTADFANERE